MSAEREALEKIWMRHTEQIEAECSAPLNKRPPTGEIVRAHLRRAVLEAAALASPSEPTPEILREWAEWFDDPGNPMVVVDASGWSPRRTAGSALRRIAEQMGQELRWGDDRDEIAEEYREEV